MLINQPLYDLTVQQLSRFRARQVIQYIVAKDVFPAARQYNLVEVRVRCFIEYLTLLVDYF